MGTSKHNISASVRKTVLERDMHQCVKCKSEQTLEVHHILPLLDGGNDDLDNLIALCSGCHQEWHLADRTTKLPFELWLTYPTYRQFIGMWRMKWPDNISAAEAKEIIRGAAKLMSSDFQADVTFN